jgi:hypothetical protein
MAIELDCEKDFDFYFSTSNISQVCKDACRPECQKVCYILTTSQATYPTESYYNTWIKSFQGAKWNSTSHDEFTMRRYMDQSFLSVIVNYGCVQYEVVKASPAITLEELIGSVGGKLSLFVGISIISILEILEIASKLICLPFRRIMLNCRHDKKKHHLNMSPRNGQNIRVHFSN